jgi:hypothetical protein
MSYVNLSDVDLNVVSNSLAINNSSSGVKSPRLFDYLKLEIFCLSILQF